MAHKKGSYSELFKSAQESIMYRDRSRGRRGEGGGGGGGWRGRRGGGRGHRSYGNQEDGEDGGRERPPPGLKGREIGMWYARRGKARKEHQEKMNRPTVAMDQHKEDNIRRLLNNIEAVDNVPPQMFRDFDDTRDDKSDDGWRQPRRHGSMLFCTTGIVLKFLEGDPMLKRASHLIIDEIHERDLQSDFLLIILKDLLPRRPDLKVILMSATLNAEMFSKYFDNSPMVNIPGFTYPVQEYLLEDVLEITRYRPDPSKVKKPRPRFRGRDREKEQEDEWNYNAWLRNLEGKFVKMIADAYSRSTIEALRNFDYTKIDLDLIMALIQYIVTQKNDGAILVFVPGWEEISNLHKLLQQNPSFNSDRYKVIPLHSLMPTVNQREVFDRPPPGVRKIVIATNIAETSITIDDVVFVIDCGKIKVKDYDPDRNLTCLEPQWVSRANSKQRRGRAGRVQPGECYHLYTGLKWMDMIDYLPPEMLRTRLEELCLQIKLLKLGRIEPFVAKAMQPPSMEALHKAIITLQELNALDEDENLLPLGVHLARMPLEPHTGKMILFGAMFCCLDPILTVAASLSFKDAFVIPLGKEKEADAARKELSEGSKSDHIVLINALKMLRDMKKQLAEILYDLGFLASRSSKDPQANIHSGDTGLVKAVLCAGFYPQVAKVAKTPKPGAPPYKMVTLHLKNGQGKDLRRQLDRLLEEKIVRPGVTNWNETEKEGALMRAIAELISTEESEGVGTSSGSQGLEVRVS
nr:hypothetical protein BaRGS_024847 [Batillaria attramentaria]